MAYSPRTWVNGTTALSATNLNAMEQGIAQANPNPVGQIGIDGRWSLEFFDEFEGTSLDLTKWKNLDGYTMNAVTARASNVSVANGMLILQLSSTTEGAYITTNINSTVGNGYLFNIGSYIEFRAYFPGDVNGAYNWTSVWTSGPSWPTNGELDVAETLSGSVTANYHYGTDAGAGHKQKNLGQPSGTWQAGWHTYGVYRRGNWADFYWDGILVRSVLTEDSGAGHSVLMNVGGSSVIGFPGALLVDYVRAWKRVETEPVFYPAFEKFNAGPYYGAPYGWIQQGFKGSVGVDALQRFYMTSPSGSFAGAPVVLWSKPEPATDCELVADVTLPDLSEQYPKIGIRCDFARGDNYPYSGYMVELRPSTGEWYLFKLVGGVNTRTILYTGTGYTYVAGGTTKVKIRAFGTTIQAKIWQSTGTEPASWLTTVTDTDVKRGRVLISGANGNDGAVRTFTVDNVFMTNV